MIIIIGRGHSGTRAISQTLYTSNVYMGNLLNNSADLVPPEKLYEACRIFGKKVKYSSNFSWDFDKILNNNIPEEFSNLVYEYLAPIIKSTNPNKGWKLPETTLIYPWIYQLFPNAKYIFWVRHPFDSILNKHETDDLNQFSVPVPSIKDILHKRAISWLYQIKIQQIIPKPQNYIDIRFEDFVIDQKNVLDKLENFLKIKLAIIPVRIGSIGKWKGKIDIEKFDYLYEAMDYYNYKYIVEN